MWNKHSGWPKGISMIGAVAYVGVFSANCWAKEPRDVEAAPVAAQIMAATTAVSGGVSGSPAMTYAPNMTGDEPIKVVPPSITDMILKSFVR